MKDVWRRVETAGPFAEGEGMGRTTQSDEAPGTEVTEVGGKMEDE